MRLFYSNECTQHAPEFEILSGNAVPYLESPDRMTKIMSQMAHDDRTSSWHWTDIDSSDHQSDETNRSNPPLDPFEAISKVHSPEYIDYLQHAYELWVQDGGSKAAVLPEVFPHPSLLATANSKTVKSKNLSPLAKAGLYCFDLSCPITADTYGSAMAAVRVVLEALRHLMVETSRIHSAKETEEATAYPPQCLGVFALTRPPGHHAGPAVCGGYCFFNNAAIAVKCLQSETARVENETPKVAILDIDYHHGNGTQEVFYSDPSVLYVSLHAEGDYPYFTGTTEEVGDGPGKDFNVNIPLPQRSTGNEEYITALKQAAGKISEYSARWLVVSLGVDTYKDDPICNFQLTSECYSKIGHEIGKLGLPTLFVMEGGYHLETLGTNVGGVLSGFANFK
ncbi:Arginase/deacetylase [Ceratobasidium sp. AG-I]|nr:Arginase/deacetylase [Ceratobasidium sp. AG-I]